MDGGPGYARRMREAPMPMGVTIGPLGSAAEAFVLVAGLGLAAVQLDAADPGMRPREMGASARRDLAVTLRRLGLRASGIDCFVPVERFADPAQVERAMEAVRGSLALAEALDRAPVCACLPADQAVAIELRREADRRGVALADFALPAPQGASAIGVDPAAMLAAGADPAAMVSAGAGRIAAARVVDLLRSGMRGPIEQSGASRLDALAYRVALEMAGFRGLPVIDCRQWTEPVRGVRASAERWMALLPAAGGAMP